MSYQDYLGENTIESTCTLASYVSGRIKREQKSAKGPSHGVSSPATNLKAAYSCGDSSQVSNMQIPRHARHERGDGKHAKHRHIDEGERDITAFKSDMKDRVYTPFIDDEGHFKEDQDIEENLSTCKIKNLDPLQFNFNIERVSTPKTMVSIREVSEDGESDQSMSIQSASVNTLESHDESLPQTHQTAKIGYDKADLGKKTKPSSTDLVELKRKGIQNPALDHVKNDQSDDDFDATSKISNEDTEESEIESAVDLLEVKSVSDISDNEKALTPKMDCLNEEDFHPFRKGRELLRTPPTDRQSATKTRIKFNSPEINEKPVLGPEKEDVTPNKKVNPRVKKWEIKKSKSAIDKSARKQNIVPARKVLSLQDESTPVKTPENECADKLTAKLDGSPWPRDVEYASKGEMPLWAETFEKTVKALKPFATIEEADAAVKKAVEDLFGTSWKLKEEAMVNVIRLTKHHPEIVCDNSTKILNAISNEVKNIRQSIAGKAIFTCGYMYQILGRRLENKLRMVIGALLMKSSNRTLASYFRLVIESLFKVVESSSPQKAAQAFVVEGGRHPNKASREIAAQFLVILTDKIGTLDSLSKNFASQMVKCASCFVSDSSAITRYCAKRMIQVFKTSPSFEKIKDQHLDVNSAKDLTKVLELIETKGVTEEVLPISVIKSL